MKSISSQNIYFELDRSINKEPHHIFFLLTFAVTDVRKLQEDLSVRSLDRKTTKLKAKNVIFVTSKSNVNIKTPNLQRWFLFENHLNIGSIYFVGRSSEQLVIDTDTRKDT